MQFTIGNVDFSFKEDAYRSIESYLSEIKKYFTSQDDENSIVDIEYAIVDKLERILRERANKVLIVSDVEKIILELGSVEMITDDEVVLQEDNKFIVGKRLYRDGNDTLIAGVCSGLGHYFGVNPWFVRILFISSFFVSIFVYGFLWFLTPLTKTKSDEFRMKGIPVSLSSLSKESEEFTKKRAKNLFKAIVILFITVVLFVISVTVIGFFLSLMHN